MNFSINPCKACLEKHKNDPDINTINNCVIETATAFSGIGSNNSLTGTGYDTNWQQCMENMKKSQGRTNCDFKLGMAPVFNQAPHYFPDLFAETKNVQNSKNICIEKCSELDFNKKSCIENCETDASAIFEEDISNINQTINTNKKSSNKNQFKDFVFVLAIFLFFVFLLGAFFMLLQKRP